MIKKIIISLLLFVYIICALGISIFLLNKNSCGYIEINDFRYAINYNSLDNIPSNSLLKFEVMTNYSETKDKDIYYVNKDKMIIKGRVSDIYEIDGIYSLEVNKKIYQSDKILGLEILSYNTILGNTLHFFENKIVFLLLIILPLLLFVLLTIKYLLFNKKNKRKLVKHQISYDDEYAPRKKKVLKIDE